MEKTKLLTIAVIGLLLLNLCTLTFLFLQQPIGKPPRPPKPDVFIIEKLQLDAQQQAQYQTMVKTHQQQIGATRDSIKQIRNILYKQLLLPPNQRTQVDTLITQFGAKQQHIEQLNFAHFNDIKQLCKPEQQANFSLLVDELAKLFSPPQPPPRR